MSESGLVWHYNRSEPDMPANEQDDVAVSGHVPHDKGFWVLLIVFISIALYNVLELNVTIAGTFKQYRGLYFWSLVVATWGIAFNAVGYLLRLLRVEHTGFLHSTILLIGWCTMITGQSLVLYSRLHFVLHHPRILRYVLTMIICNAIWLGIPVIVLVYGSNSSHPDHFTGPYSIFEKVQLSVFTVQELIISSLYIYETGRMLKLQRSIGPSFPRSILTHLILVNIFVVCLDVSVLTLECTDRSDVQTAWKPVVYSLKLKVEFSVLNRLVELSQHMRSRPVTCDTGAEMALESGTSSTGKALSADSGRHPSTSHTEQISPRTHPVNRARSTMTNSTYLNSPDIGRRFSLSHLPADGQGISISPKAHPSDSPNNNSLHAI